ncbi:MAG: universal stress protein [Acidobacteria bacterium]|nr:universal stress protein [Acidobacteriota bacterium]
MKKMERIVLATDFSSSAEPAHGLASALAKALDAELHLLHAIVLHGDDLYGLALPVADLDQHADRIQESALHQLEEIAAPLQQKGIRVTQAVRRGTHAVSTILEYQEEVGADLLVLGTHGRRGPGRWLLGSVAEEVARRAPCEVLTVRQSVDTTGEVAIRRILVPLDFSEASKESLGVARSLAELWGARIHLLHLVEPVIVPGPYGMLPAGQPVTLDYEMLASKAREQMEALMDGVPADRYEIHSQIGSARVDIVEIARRLPADLIVQASRGLTGLPRLLLGSTAEHVLRSAECPVLTVKTHAEEG